MARARQRHWKQQFDLAADFIYTRQVRVGEPDNPWVDAGSDVNKESYGHTRLRRMWDAGFIELKDFVAPVPTSIRDARRAELVPTITPDAPPAPAAVVVLEVPTLSTKVEVVVEEPKPVAKKKTRKKARKKSTPRKKAASKKGPSAE